MNSQFDAPDLRWFLLLSSLPSPGGYNDLFFSAREKLLIACNALCSNPFRIVCLSVGLIFPIESWLLVQSWFLHLCPMMWKSMQYIFDSPFLVNSCPDIGAGLEGMGKMNPSCVESLNLWFLGVGPLPHCRFGGIVSVSPSCWLDMFATVALCPLLGPFFTLCWFILFLSDDSVSSFNLFF